MVTYKGYQISGTSGEYFVVIDSRRIGPFAHYSLAENFIDDYQKTMVKYEYRRRT